MHQLLFRNLLRDYGSDIGNVLLKLRWGNMVVDVRIVVVGSMRELCFWDVFDSDRLHICVDLHWLCWWDVVFDVGSFCLITMFELCFWDVLNHGRVHLD